MKDRYDSFPMGKDRGESFVLTVGRKKPHERPESCRMSYAKTTILRWRSFVEQAYDTKNRRRWRQDRRTYDKLEAAAMMCFYAHRTRKFRLTRYIKDFAAYFGCSPRTIRRALKDGCYYREEVFGTNVERIALREDHQELCSRGEAWAWQEGFAEGRTEAEDGSAQAERVVVEGRAYV